MYDMYNMYDIPFYSQDQIINLSQHIFERCWNKMNSNQQSASNRAIIEALYFDRF